MNLPFSQRNLLVFPQIIKHQKDFKKGKVFAIRKIVQKINRPDKNAKENQAGKKERFESVLNVIKVSRLNWCQYSLDSH